MSSIISVNVDQINALDLSPAIRAIAPLLPQIKDYEQQIEFAITYPLEPDDPRELPEVPEVRLWFIRLDALYPWLPFVLNWKSGEFARYTAMLVPHQFSKEGIQFNPEALEIYVMHKTFVLLNWFKDLGIESPSRLKAMTQLLGYELDDGFFEMLSHP
ncbi:CRR6 family NdhI maturation factor [Myxacorys almedinensis]|uniref:CRR6 family NdhI maturation factor n=1 Tax=Myxacorys almedinensis A TaxID=2690445 RepID=A0A8J8CJB4_9CYAN|nr:CRR6 family NdhI maturation factor [Myxacorys almedinensis]NDJ18484.1 CRR6 family NdhI maturation factor [Myxacorys almedinensis A]